MRVLTSCGINGVVSCLRGPLPVQRGPPMERVQPLQLGTSWSRYTRHNCRPGPSRADTAPWNRDIKHRDCANRRFAGILPQLSEFLWC